MNRQEIKVLEPEQKVAEISKDFKVIEKKSEQFAVIKNPASAAIGGLGTQANAIGVHHLAFAHSFDPGR